MTTGKTNSDMAALAAEVCDLWQDHLTTLASDPLKKAELVRLLEPQRQLFSRLFADYATMMQHGGNAKHTATTDPTTSQNLAAAPRTSTAAASSDDGALRVAQFTHRLAALEERLTKLEARTKRSS